METFENQYMNRLWDDNPRNRRLRELAWQYLTMTEDYDWTICRARRGRFAMIIGLEEFHASNRHARLCMNQIISTLHSEGYSDIQRKDVLNEVRKIEPAFEAQYNPSRVAWESLPNLEKKVSI